MDDLCACTQEVDTAMGRSDSAGRAEIVRAKDNVPVVTLSDRAEAVVAVLTAIDAQAGGAVMASRQVRVTGRAVLDRGE
jgi:hypothetical protein